MLNITISNYLYYKINEVPKLRELSFLTGQKKGRVLLYSSYLDKDMGRYSILLLNPIFSVSYKNGIQERKWYHNNTDEIITRDFRDSLSEIFTLNSRMKDLNFPAPFYSGWVSYDSHSYFLNTESPKEALLDIPDFYFVFSDTFLVVDNELNNASIYAFETSVSEESAKERYERLKNEVYDILSRTEYPFTSEKISARALVKKEDYFNDINKIKEYISNGDVYQINYTYPFVATSSISSSELFYRYLTMNLVDFAAFINGDNYEIISISPECLISLKNGSKVSSFPIKGTIRKSGNIKEDLLLSETLIHSEKDRAELAMIVDLIRNDIGKISVPGSVTVDFHARIMEFPTLFHLFSSITGKINDVEGLDVFLSLFPGGSITGAPKISAVNIISKIEKYKRGVYTGAIGWVGVNGNSVFNIPIRTIQRDGETLFYNAGGGITWLSEPELELEESLTKTRSFLNIFSEWEILFD